MSFGLLAHNANGDTVIDSIFQNHVVAESGSNVLSPVETGLYTFSFTNSYDWSQQPLIFVRSASNYAGMYSWTENLTTHKITGAGLAVSANSTTVNWKLLVTPGAAGSDTEGIRVYDDAGVIVFDSGLEYLPIVDAVDVVPSSPGNFTHASATTPYYCVTSLDSWWSHQIAIPDPPFTEPTIQRLGVKNVDGTTGNCGWSITHSFSWTGSEAYYTASTKVLVGDAG